MNKEKEKYLTPTQFVLLIPGILVGVFIFRLPGLVVKSAHQDAWISMIISLIYPAYVLLISNYVIKKYPDETILMINRRYLGKFFGNMLNVMFMLSFMLLTIFITGNLVYILYVYNLSFLQPSKIAIVIIIVASYAAYFDLGVLGKINEVMFIPTVLTIFVTAAAISKGSIVNFMPVFESSFTDILKGSKEALFSFLHIEVVLLIHPYFKEKKSIKKLSIIGAAISSIIYIWVVMISIFVLGNEVTTKAIWPYVFVGEVIDMPIVNNFKSLFIIFWNLIQFKVITNEYLFSTFIFNDITGFNRKKVVLYLLPLYTVLTIVFLNQGLRKFTSEYIIPLVVLFNLFYISIIGFLVAVKPRKYQKKR